MLEYLMKSEQLFEIDRQINQIRRDLEQRQQKVAEWDVPLSRILKDRSDKDFYLSKKYTKAHLEHYLDAENSPKEARQMLQQHTQKARNKVIFFRNDLRQLQELLQRRNIFRLKEGRSSCRLKIEKQPRGKSDFSKTTYEPTHEAPNRRNDREHSAFTTLKGEKVLEVYQEGKQRGEQPLSHLTRFLGVGIESTPFFGWAQKKRQAQWSLNKTKPRTTEQGKQKLLKLPIQLQRQASGRPQIYLTTGNHKREEFQQRLKRVMMFSHHQSECLRVCVNLRS